MLNRRFVITAAAAALGVTTLAGPAAAAKIPLNQLSRYLNDLRTATSDFTQVNDDGTISTGTIYISRPGRMRFDYNPPDRTAVLVGGGSVAVFDGKSNANGPEQYPLSRTPLSIILERNVDLGRRNMVVGHREDGVKTIVTAQDPENPDAGRIDLVFTGNPVQLRQWIITDNGGTKTTVVLGDLKRGGSIPSRLFNIGLEAEKRGG